MPERLYSVEEAAEKIGVSVRTVWRYVEEGRFDHLMIVPAGKYRHVAFTQKTFTAYKQKYGSKPEREKRTYNRRIKKYQRTKKPSMI